MINYYFFQFIKKNSDRTMDRPVGVRPPGGQRWDEFDFFEFGPPNTVPCGTVNRPGLDRTGPDQTVFNTLTAWQEDKDSMTGPMKHGKL
jgi:hypothetical protein